MKSGIRYHRSTQTMQTSQVVSQVHDSFTPFPLPKDHLRTQVIRYKAEAHVFRTENQKVCISL